MNLIQVSRVSSNFSIKYFTIKTLNTFAKKINKTLNTFAKRRQKYNLFHFLKGHSASESTTIYKISI